MEKWSVVGGQLEERDCRLVINFVSVNGIRWPLTAD
jgi:hypothetical protein